MEWLLFTNTLAYNTSVLIIIAQGWTTLRDSTLWLGSCTYLQIFD